MDPVIPAATTTSRLFRIAFAAVLVLIVGAEGYLAVVQRQRDFSCHLAFGQHFLRGEPYLLGGNVYPLFRAMLDAVPASMGYHAARTAFYAAAVLGLAATFWVWARLANPPRPLVAVALTIAVLLPLLLRDL